MLPAVVFVAADTGDSVTIHRALNPWPGPGSTLCGLEPPAEGWPVVAASVLGSPNHVCETCRGISATRPAQGDEP